MFSSFTELSSLSFSTQLQDLFLDFYRLGLYSEQQEAQLRDDCPSCLSESDLLALPLRTSSANALLSFKF